MNNCRLADERGIYRAGAVHVCARMCETCIFRPGNLMMLRSGRVESMVEQCLRTDSVIPCHETLDGKQAVCRGFFNRHERDVFPLRIARPFRRLVEV